MSVNKTIIIIIVTVFLLFTAVLHSRKYFGTNGISVPMSPFGSNDSVSITEDGVYLNHAMKSRLVFTSNEVINQNLSQIQLNDSDSKLRTISDYIGEHFIARNIHNWDSDHHYLVLDNESRIWHFHFSNNNLLQRTCVKP